MQHTPHIAKHPDTNHPVTSRLWHEEMSDLNPSTYSTDVGAVRNEIPQALAIDHNFLSSRDMVSARAISGTTPSKTHLFRW
jgi:hypothetical protein